jgi:hypothetical protein
MPLLVLERRYVVAHGAPASQPDLHRHHVIFSSDGEQNPIMTACRKVSLNVGFCQAADLDRGPVGQPLFANLAREHVVSQAFVWLELVVQHKFDHLPSIGFAADRRDDPLACGDKRRFDLRC